MGPIPDRLVLQLSPEGVERRTAELEAQAVAGKREDGPVVVPSKHPGIGVDLTLTHAVALPWQEISRAIRKAAPADLIHWTLKDRYAGKGVPSGAVNTTIHFFYNALDRSLTQDEVNERHSRLTETLEGRFRWASEQGRG